ncbi:MAG: hypothetical protein CME64_13835 [Halobacteriovoraceae bacterium]|nr:hypothetical protein [Halobacteriovoraceae bacterium]|tara:strand:- start:23741 stop:25006 length:1266 start_codon:yes stop_codon:yes gene_type:complete
MEQKILIADDSLTIQKVIKITLANEPFELHDCSQASILKDTVESLRPAMVLLDFNLSENKTGYDLCREIKAVDSKIQVLMLFGTFDTIDEGLLADCGCNYHIVKPFDGTKFINLCRSMASDYESGDTGSEATSAVEESSDFPEPISTSEEDEWVVNQPSYEEPVEEKLESSEPNPLENEIESWGMEVPSIIGAEEETQDYEIPSVIASSESAEKEEVSSDLAPSDEAQSLDSEEAASSEEPNLPSSSDLEYPSEITTQEPETSSKLISLDELSPDEDMDVFEGGTETEEDVKNLESLIEDEVGEEGDLWAADVIESSDEEDEDLPMVEPHGLEEVSSTPSDFPADVMEQQIEPIDVEKMSKDIKSELEKELSDKLSPLVEKYIQEYCEQQVEKIAWEVIPDLAENLIKKEIQKISDSILDQ